MKNLLKKLLIIFLFVLFIFLFYNFVFAKFLNKYVLEKESVEFSESIQNSPFSVSKVIMYSSGYGENQNTTFQKSNWVLNILQYSDIAIYLEHSGETLTSSNTIKQLSLENLQISAPKIGTPALYYLDSLNFGTATFSQIHKLDNSIEFTVLNDENKNKEIQSNTPVFFTDCSNPITLKYVNQSIKENYTITSHEPVFFDGRLLQMANVPLADLEADIHFDIYLKSNDNIDYFYHLSLPIFLENDDSSIYDGSILVEKSFENYKFLKK